MTADLESLKAMWHELKAHVDRLVGERQQYLDFFEQSGEAYLVTDAHGTIADANGAAVDILQRRKRYLRGKPLAALVALDQRSTFRRRLHALAGGSTERTWRTIIESPQLRTEVTLTGRLMGTAGQAGGICWLLQVEP